MRDLGILVLVIVLGSGLTLGYLMYRQLDNGTATLEASLTLERNAEGALCGDVELVVDARTLGRWFLPVEDGQTVVGMVAVQGDEAADIGVRIWSPTNRVVMSGPKRAHEQEFELDSTIRGDYRFEFDNRHSSFSSKELKVSLCVT